MSDSTPKPTTYGLELSAPLHILNPALIEQVEHALKQVGSFGEVRLVVVKGRLRFIQVMQSQAVDSSNNPKQG
ncbi:hypothetical protein D6833_07875 [Candidatus Parcubacteria bacterium]|nr:MAG: hypothetical protein D6833_07875 [Candidatus Parcubacteria bacterium]